MLEEQNKYRWTIGILIILIIFLWIRSNNLEKQAAALEALVSDYSSALQDANHNIEEANSIIEDAQSYAWSSYEDMGNALDSLSTVDTVSEP